MVCFGEALWDVLPQGIFLGGAPLNAAYHLARQGVTVAPISAVGRDFLGDEAVRRATAWGLDLRGLARVANAGTGLVRARLDARGVASYQIERDAAWDRIPFPREVANGPAPVAVVYGSLALREESNRRVLARLFAQWPEARRVLDINLRAPHERGAGVTFALRHAQVVKLNDTELGRLTRRSTRTPRELERAAIAFGQRHGVARVCVTAGERGAGLWWDGRWQWERGRRVEVRDTVGAGDAFLGALLAALWRRGESPRAALAGACRLGEFVAARDGATPPYRCDAHGRPHDAAA